MTEYKNIIYEKEEDGIAIITFNRPHVMNAANWKMGEDSREAVQLADEDDEVRVLIYTGAGRGFHSGDDVKGMFLSQDTYGGDYEEHRRKARMDWLKGPRRAIPR